MNWLNKLERKFGRYAVPNLIVYLIGAYSVGFVLNMVAPNILGFLNFQPYYILHGQIWRLITWILMPTDSNIIFLLIMMMFYYQLGTALERASCRKKNGQIIRQFWKWQGVTSRIRNYG